MTSARQPWPESRVWALAHRLLEEHAHRTTLELEGDDYLLQVEAVALVLWGEAAPVDTHPPADPAALEAARALRAAALEGTG